MSTTLLIGRTPRVSSRLQSHQGLWPTFAPEMTRAVKRGQRSVASTVTPVRASTGGPDVAGRGSGTRSGVSNSTAISRATPRWPRQSGRLLVTSRSIARSPPTSAVDSWFKPASARRSVRDSTGMSSRTYCVSQFQLTIIVFLARDDPSPGMSSPLRRGAGLPDLGGEMIPESVDLVLQVAQQGDESLPGTRDLALDDRAVDGHGLRLPARVAEVAGVGPGDPEPGRLRLGGRADLEPQAAVVGIGVGPRQLGHRPARDRVAEQGADAVQGVVAVLLQAVAGVRQV